MNQSDKPPDIKEEDVRPGLLKSDGDSAETDLKLLKLINQSLRLETRTKDNEILLLRKENDQFRKENILLKKNLGKINKTLFQILGKTLPGSELYGEPSEQTAQNPGKNALSVLESLSVAGISASPSAGKGVLPALEDNLPDVSFTPRDANFTSRDANFTPTDTNFIPRDANFISGAFDFNSKDTDFNPGGFNFNSRAFHLFARPPYFISRNSYFISKTPYFISRDIDFNSKDFHFNSKDFHFNPKDSSLRPDSPNLTAGISGDSGKSSANTETASGKPSPLEEKKSSAVNPPIADKTLDFEVIVQDIIHKAGKHLTYMTNGVRYIQPNKREKHTAGLILKALENSCSLYAENERNRLAAYRMIMSLRQEFSPRNKVITTFISMAKIIFYLYNNGKFTISGLCKTFGFSKTYGFTIRKLFLQKGWIEEFIPYRSDGFYCSNKFRQFVEGVLSGI